MRLKLPIVLGVMNPRSQLSLFLWFLVSRQMSSSGTATHPQVNGCLGSYWLRSGPSLLTLIKASNVSCLRFVLRHVLIMFIAENCLSHSAVEGERVIMMFTRDRMFLTSSGCAWGVHHTPLKVGLFFVS